MPLSQKLFYYIFSVDLLKNTGEFVDVLLDLQEDMCENWATAEFVQALLEAIKQIG